jgi:hypothetical protein
MGWIEGSTGIVATSVVLIHRLGRAGVQPSTVHEAVAIIDEAAQRIERL